MVSKSDSVSKQIRLQKVRETSIGSTALLEKKHRQVYSLDAIKTLDKMDAAGSAVQLARLEKNRERARNETKDAAPSAKLGRLVEPQLPDPKARDLIGIDRPMEEVRARGSNPWELSNQQAPPNPKPATYPR